MSLKLTSYLYFFDQPSTVNKAKSIEVAKGPFVNYLSILGYLVGQKRAISAYF